MIYTASSPQDMLTEVCSTVLYSEIYGGSKRAKEAQGALLAYEQIPHRQRAHLAAAERYALQGNRGLYMMELDKLQTGK